LTKFWVSNFPRTNFQDKFLSNFSKTNFFPTFPRQVFFPSFQDQDIFKMDAFRVCSFEEQFNTATQILGNFKDGGRQVLLAAQMQSGKTGIFLTLAIMMLELGLVKRVVIICGSNETELHKQLVKSCNDTIVKYCASNPEYVEVVARLRPSIEAYKSTGATGLDAAGRIERETLVIWDESHYAQTTRNKPFKFLQHSGLSVSGTERSDALWAAKDSYFLSVSATPFAEFSDSNNSEFLARMRRRIVWHVPSVIYRGVAYYHSNNAIRRSFSVRENVDEFKMLIASHKAKKNYALVRSLNLDVVRACCAAEGVEYKEYTSKSKKDLEGGIDALKIAPERFTVIGLKGMCRMGKVVPKRHMAFVYEESKQANTDCILQSFLGRMCGHNSEDDPFPEEVTQIYVPECFLKISKRFGVSELERYLRFTEGEIIMPTKASCLGPKPKTSGQCTLQARWVPFSTFEDDADMDDPEDALVMVKNACARDRTVKGGKVVIKERARLHDEEREAYIRLALTYLEDNRYPDEVQHEFATGVLNRSDPTRFVDFPVLYTYAEAHQANLQAAAAAGERFGSFKDGRKPEGDEDPTTEGDEPIVKYFKLYRCVDGFFITGFTDEASSETESEVKSHIVKTNGKEVWNPSTDAIVPQTISIIHTADDLRKELNLLSSPIAQRTFYVHKSLARNNDALIHGSSIPIAGLVAQIARKAASGKGGKIWPKKEKAKRDEYERFVLPAGITIQIEVKIDINVTVNGKSEVYSSTKFTQSIRLPVGGAGASD
jgi:hypothetical protein